MGRNVSSAPVSSSQPSRRTQDSGTSTSKEAEEGHSRSGCGMACPESPMSEVNVTGGSMRTNLQLCQATLNETHPITGEVFPWCDTQTDDSKRIGYWPISRLRCHVSRLWVNDLNSLRPLGVIDFRLRSLRSMSRGVFRTQSCVRTLAVEYKSWNIVSANADLRRVPCAFSNDFDKDSRNSAPSSKHSGGYTWNDIIGMDRHAYKIRGRP